jgi:dienelactone hydrolase
MPVACLLAAGAAMAQQGLLFKKNGVLKFWISENGNLNTDAGYYSESAPGSAAAGELAFRESTLDPGQEMITSANGDLLVKGRIVRLAVMPTASGNLGFKSPPGTRAATLTKSGDLYLASLPSLAGDPSYPGPFAYTSAVYASSGTQLISRFQTPTANYVTPRKDISPFFNSLDNATWGFGASSVPLNGTLRIPTGAGPFPLVLFVHGNHDELDYSDEGYLYLCDRLASQGIIAGSLDANFLNGGSRGENDARAILHLEHVKQFRTWNAQSGHPLFGKVDLSRVMIVGHSRGGEGVAHASYFNGLSSVVADAGGPTIPLTGGSNGLGPYNFGIKCVFAIAPTDGQYVPVGGPRGVDHNYFVIHGGRDGDLKAFWGLATFDRTHKPNAAGPSSTAPGFKAFCFPYNANHNFFNTTWDADFGDPGQVMPRADQEQLARVYVGALAQSQLFGRSGFMDLLREPTGFSNVYRPFSSTYVTAYQDRQRTFFNHYEEDANPSTLSAPFTGANYWFGQSFVEEDLSLAANPWHRTKGLRLDWSSGSGLYAISMNSPAPSYPFLALRIGQNNDPSNPVGGNQNCLVWAADGTGHWGSVTCDAYGSLPYPRQAVLGDIPTTMQTLRIPMSEYANQGVNVNDIRAVQLEFGTLTNQGSVYADEFQFSY